VHLGSLFERDLCKTGPLYELQVSQWKSPYFLVFWSVFYKFWRFRALFYILSLAPGERQAGCNCRAASKVSARRGQAPDKFQRKLSHCRSKDGSRICCIGLCIADIIFDIVCGEEKHTPSIIGGTCTFDSRIGGFCRG
jgi:hypothetical protein